jgi:hypothetical protein
MQDYLEELLEDVDFMDQEESEADDYLDEYAEV